MKKQSKLRIGIDMRMMKPFPTGIGSHYLNLIHTLISEKPDVQYVCIVNSRGEAYVKEFFKDLVGVEYAFIDINGGTFTQHMQFISLRRKIAALRLDVLLTDPWSAFVWMPVPYTLMVYDLIGFHHLVKLSRKQVLYDKFLFRYIAKNARTIIASVKFVKDDVIQFFSIPEKNIYVAMPSVSKEYQQPVSTEIMQEVQKKYGVSGRYFVYIGNRRPHKNILLALQMFDTLVRNGNGKYADVSFVLIGGYDTEDANDKKEESFLATIASLIPDTYTQVKILGKIFSNIEVAALLKGAVALFHPTLFEGYGITPLEAANVGVPVVATNIPPVEQVMLDAALLNDPLNVEKNVESLQSFLESESLREAYIAKGHARAKEISWKSAADEMYNALMAAAKK